VTDQPRPDPAAPDLLDRAHSLFQQADQELARGLGRHVDEDDMSRLYRANLLFSGAAAGYRGAQAMASHEHLELLRQFEERAEARTQGFESAMHSLAGEPLTDGEYLRSLEAWRDLVLALLGPMGQPDGDAFPDWQRQARAAVLTAPRRGDGRDPYDPPTLTGPHEVTDDHWFIKEPVLRDELPVPTLGRVRFFKPGLYEVDISQTGIDRIELVSEGDPRPAAAEWRREPDGS